MESEQPKSKYVDNSVVRPPVAGTAETQPWTVERTLNYTEQRLLEILSAIHAVKIMQKELAGRGADASLGSEEVLQKLTPMGEYELQLIQIQVEINRLKTAVFDKGMHITHEAMTELAKGTKAEIYQQMRNEVKV